MSDHFWEAMRGRIRTVAAVIGAIGIITGLTLGWLARHDYQMVTSREIQERLDRIERRQTSVVLNLERLNAYAVANREWTIRVSDRLHLPDPPKPRLYEPEDKQRSKASDPWGIDAEAAEPGGRRRP